MILGTCNFNRDYNGPKINEVDCYKTLDLFYRYGGNTIDTALNYNGVHKIISDSKWQGQIITKVWNEKEIEQCFDELKTNKIYCILARDSKNENLINKLKELKSKGMIDKYGISIYYPHELRQDVNVIFIQNDDIWPYYFKTMILHADINMRSFFNMNKKDIHRAKIDYDCYKKFERLDLNHKVNAVIGISNTDQLKQNMELFS